MKIRVKAMIMKSRKSFSLSISFSFSVKELFEAGIYLPNINNKKLKSKVFNMFKNKYTHLKDVKCSHSAVFFVNFEHISQIVLVFCCRF